MLLVTFFFFFNEIAALALVRYGMLAVFSFLLCSELYGYKYIFGAFVVLW